MSPHAKHTPGKFLVFRNVSDEIYEVETDDPKSDEEIEATMALLESSPALFEALKQFVSEYVALINSGDCGNWDPETEEKVIKARAALSSAQPEAPTE